MKKVLAFLSVLVFTLVAIGLVTNTAQVSAAAEPAAGKFFVNPTLEDDEIPMYIMDSIYTTFPRHFDYEGAKGTDYEDKNWQNGRLYAWNEMKLFIPQYDLTTGLPTGQRYASYQYGSMSANDGTASYIYVYNVVDGALKMQQYSKGAVYANDNHSHGNPSLDTIVTNISGVDIEAPLTTIKDKGEILNYVVFDGDGKMIRGLLKDSSFDPTTADYVRPIFGFQNDQLVLRDLVGDDALDRATALVDTTVPEVDEQGIPKTDADGNPIYVKEEVLTDDPKLASGSAYRYIWEHFSEEEFQNVKVNTVNYLQEGWLADRWDYALEDENGGYTCIAVIGGNLNYGAITAQVAAVHNASVRALEAAGEENLPILIQETDNEGVIEYAKYVRPAFAEVTVPAGGIVYNFGYLSYTGAAIGVAVHFADIVIQGFYNGRHAGYGAETRAYNFSTRPLTLENVVQNNQSYLPTGSLNRIEVLKGEVFKPSWVLNHTGVLGGFKDLNNILSYSLSTVNELKFEVFVDGVRTVYDVAEKFDPRFPNRVALQEGILTDYFNWLVKHGKAKTAIGDDLQKFMHSGTAGEKNFKGTWVAEMRAYTFWPANSGTNPWGSKANPADAGSFMECTDAWETYEDAWTIWNDALVLYSAGAASYFSGGQYTPAFRLNLHFDDSNATYNTAVDTSIVPKWCGTWQPHEFTWDTFDEMVLEFLTDFYNWLKGLDKVTISTTEHTIWPNGVCTLEEFLYNVKLEELTDENKLIANGLWRQHLGMTTGVHYNYYPLWGTSVGKPTDDPSKPYFFHQNYEKWSFLVDHFEAVAKAVETPITWAGMWNPTVYFANYLYKNETSLYIASAIEATGVKLIDGVNILTAAPTKVRESGYVEILPPSYSDLVIDTANDALNTAYDFRVTVLNKETKSSSELTFKIVVVDAYTPIITIDKNKLLFSATTTKINLDDVVKAYDHYYDAKNNQILGHVLDIEYIFPAGFDPQNVKPGKYNIIARAHNGNKVATTSFTITVNDNVAPTLYLAEVAYVAYGGGFDAKSFIYTAYDNVDGNLFSGNVQHEWLIVDDRDLDTSAPGSQAIVYITIMDSSGNQTRKSIAVYVGFAGDSGNIETKIDQILEKVGGKTPGSSEQSDCSQLTASYFISFAALAALAVLVLRKKN